MRDAAAEELDAAEARRAAALFGAASGGSEDADMPSTSGRTAEDDSWAGRGTAWAGLEAALLAQAVMRGSAREGGSGGGAAAGGSSGGRRRQQQQQQHGWRQVHNRPQVVQAAARVQAAAARVGLASNGPSSSVTPALPPPGC
jgi:hypothetical protein